MKQHAIKRDHKLQNCSSQVRSEQVFSETQVQSKAVEDNGHFFDSLALLQSKLTNKSLVFMYIFIVFTQ